MLTFTPQRSLESAAAVLIARVVDFDLRLQLQQLYIIVAFMTHTQRSSFRMPMHAWSCNSTCCSLHHYPSSVMMQLQSICRCVLRARVPSQELLAARGSSPASYSVTSCARMPIASSRGNVHAVICRVGAATTATAMAGTCAV